MLDWLKTILGDAYTEEIDKKVSQEIAKLQQQNKRHSASGQAFHLLLNKAQKYVKLVLFEKTFS